MERYSEYKNSGVKWLGQIPSHWEMRKMKFSFVERSKKGFPTLPLLAATQNHGVIKKEEYENRTVEATKSLDTLKLVEKGDFVISLRSFQGGIELCHERGIISPAYTVLRPSHIEASYFKHLGKSPVFIQLLKSTVTGIREGQNIDYGKLRDNLIPIPTRKEQQAIANYLDAMTSKIDAAIAQQQKMIDLLNERKQIIINNAVTKGLDPNVKMKPSGIDWIGDINENWDLYKLKHLLKSNLMYGANESAESDDLSLPRYIRITDIDEDGNLRPDTFKSLSREKAAPYLLKRGDVLFARSGATAGKSYLFDEDLEACFAGYLIKASLKESLQPKFLAYYTKSGIYDNWKNSIFIQATIPNIGADKYANLMIPLPSMKEQIIIIQQLDIETEKLNNIIRACKKQISLLQERKQIIINDVVTGKVKVV